VPLWDPYTLCGTPNVGMPTYPYYPPRLLAHTIFSPVTAHQILVLGHFFLVGFFASLFLLEQDLDLAPSLLGGTACAWGGHAMAWAEFESVSAAIAWALFCLWQLERLKKEHRDAVGWLGIGFALILVPGHAQYSALCAALTCCYAIWSLRIGKKLAWTGGAFALGTGGATLFLAPLLQLTALAGRPSVPVAEILTSSQLTASHFLTFINPEFLGASKLGFYIHHPKGPIANPEEFWIFLGCVPFLLALNGIKKAPFFACTAVLAALHAAGPLHYLLAGTLPIVDKLVPGRSVSIVSLSLGLLAAYGMQAWQDQKSSSKATIVVAGVGVVSVLFTLGAAFTRAPWFTKWTANPGYQMPPNYTGVRFWTEFLNRAVEQHYSFANPIWWVTLASLSLGVFVLVRRPSQAAAIVLLSATCLELFFFSQRLYDWQQASAVFSPQPGLQFLKENLGAQRVAPVLSGPRPNTLLPYQIREIGGYHPLYPARVARFWERAAKAPVLHVVAVIGWSPEYRRLVDLTSGKLVYTDPLRIMLEPSDFGAPIYEYDIRVYENDRALPRAFLCSAWRRASNQQEALDIVFSEGFDPATEVVVEGVESSGQGGESVHSPVSLQLDTPHEIRLTTSSSQPTRLVLTDTYYPGWNCYVDEQRTEIAPTNGMFRSVFLTAGSHQVIFRFEPAWYRWAWVLSVLSWTVCLGLVWSLRSKT
jgi:hypothetical protein